MTPAEWLRERAESYGRDAARLRGMESFIGEAGLTGNDWSYVYEAVRDELRLCAAQCSKGPNA